MDPKVLKHLKTTLRVHSKALGIPSGSANVFIDRSIKDATKSLDKRKIITETDFNRALTKELKKYHKDLAYVYENYAKII